MNTALPLLFGLAILAFIGLVLMVPIGFIILFVRRGKERSAPLRAQAEALGLAFSAGQVREVPRDVMDSPLFEGSLDPKAYDLARGELGGALVLLFDHASLRVSGGSIESGRRTAFVRRVVAAIRTHAPQAARGEGRVAPEAGLFRQLSVAEPRNTPGIPSVQRLDLTKNPSLAAQPDLHHGLLALKPSTGATIPGDWLIAAREAHGTPSDRLVTLGDAVAALTTVAPDQGAAVSRALLRMVPS